MITFIVLFCVITHTGPEYNGGFKGCCFCWVWLNGYAYRLCGCSGIIFWMRPANERRRYIVTSSLIDRAQGRNDLWMLSLTDVIVKYCFSLYLIMAPLRSCFGEVQIPWFCILYYDLINVLHLCWEDSYQLNPLRSIKFPIHWFQGDGFILYL